ncbi:hypothetical protein [Prochlorothrix hollandica]|nr:hypothetical protein [Prochlorothrix hollandica]
MIAIFLPLGAPYPQQRDRPQGFNPPLSRSPTRVLDHLIPGVC